MKNTFNMDHVYDSKGMMDEDGLMVLIDMHGSLGLKDWDRDKAIAYVAWNHRCHKDKATAMIDWALGIFNKGDK